MKPKYEIWANASLHRVAAYRVNGIRFRRRGPILLVHEDDIPKACEVDQMVLDLLAPEPVAEDSGDG